ncbi:Inhibitor of Bruton tyrosine kinase [Armadillidium nasatum]|uniref:Inhibitor of Bruton tyrosine kinase n=1 Tax=Armadillidium nasatum TaxID=96803 RepID=A0A5N5SLX1_9CRUS|nr:Inhibitor of Bruton tyrosine kinase [Armadillidium nasatum]
MTKPTKGKNTSKSTKCLPNGCMHNEHGDQICEAIRKPGSNDNQSICYILLVHFLVTHGADINLKDGISSHTPLHMAVLSRNIGTALVLIKYGADTSLADKYGYTPLRYLIEQQPLKISGNKFPVLYGYSWGINANYNLGLANAQSREVPEYVELPLKKGNVLFTLSMNKFHTVFLSSFGKVFVCGHGRGGRLGLDTDSSVIVPQYVKISNSRVGKISAGVDHTLFLNTNYEVLSCGTNKYHQLGVLPPPLQVNTPQILKEWHIKNPNVKVIGVAAAAYHSVIWSTDEVFTFGLNAGQIGHPEDRKEMFIDLPRSIDYIKKLHKDRVGEISDVIVSDGATVVVTSLGNLIACYDYKTYFIPLKVKSIVKVACIGGSLDSTLGVKLFSSHKSEDLKIAILLSSGVLFVWEGKTNDEKVFNIWEICDIIDFCINTQGLSLVDSYGDVYYGFLGDKIVTSKEKLFESNIYQYFYNKGAQCIKNIEKREKIPMLYRTQRIFSDPKGNNFIALQYDPRLFVSYEFLTMVNVLTEQIAEFYMKTKEFKFHYDTDIYVGSRCFPAHSYILAYNSEFFYEKLKHCLKESNNDENFKIYLDVDPDIFEEVLNIMYYVDTNKSIFNEPNRFVQYPSEKTVKDDDGDWRVHNFVYLEYKGKEISEYINKPSSRNPNRVVKLRRKDTNIKYPLKPIKDISCSLNMVDLQDLLLRVNQFDLDNDGANLNVFFSQLYAPTRVYNRSKFPEFWDLSFKCEDGVIVKAHKFIVMARSSYFEALLDFKFNMLYFIFLILGFQEQTDETIEISIPSNILIPILDFLYTDDTPLVSESKDLDFLCRILMLAHQYLIEELNVLCQISLFRCLTLKNCFDLLRFCLVYDAVHLRDAILEFICLNIAYYFDNTPRDLSEEVISIINKSYKEMLQMPVERNREVPKHQEVNFMENKIFEINSDARLANYEDDLTKFADFFHVPKKTTFQAPLSTTVKATVLPTLEDLEMALQNNEYITAETPRDWNQKNEDFNSASIDKTPTVNVEKKRKVSHKKRVRRSSSSSQTSTGSNSESEIINDTGSIIEPFSFEDLEDRVQKPNNVSSEPEWRTVARSKTGVGENTKAQNRNSNCSIDGFENQTESSQQDSFSFSDDSLFPTLGERLNVGTPHKESSSQMRRMPRFPVKSKKSPKNQKSIEEPKIPSSPPCAWGFGSPEKSSFSFTDIVKSEVVAIATPVVASSLKNSSSQAKHNLMDDFIYSNSGQPMKKRTSKEEVCHWNPVTNSVVESPRDTGDISLSSIMQNEVMHIKHLELQKNKPLSLIQLEEKAMKELLEFYGGEFNPEERITVRRCDVNFTAPSWNVQH